MSLKHSLLFLFLVSFRLELSSGTARRRRTGLLLLLGSRFRRRFRSLPAAAGIGTGTANAPAPARLPLLRRRRRRWGRRGGAPTAAAAGLLTAGRCGLAHGGGGFFRCRDGSPRPACCRRATAQGSPLASLSRRRGRGHGRSRCGRVAAAARDRLAHRRLGLLAVVVGIRVLLWRRRRRRGEIGEGVQSGGKFTTQASRGIH